MERYGKTFDKIVEEQIQKWQSKRKSKYKKRIRPVITVSRLPGCNAREIAKKLSEDLEIDFFDQEIIDRIANDANVNRKVVETLDEQDNSIVIEWLSALTTERHLWPYEYVEHLTKLVGTIGAHGHAVILGRGASFILPKEVCLRVLVVAPLELRIRNVQKKYKVTEKEARRNVMNVESDRCAFVRRYFHADMLEPVNYDLVFNTESCDQDMVVEMVKHAYNNRQWYKYTSD